MVNRLSYFNQFTSGTGGGGGGAGGKLLGTLPITGVSPIPAGASTLVASLGGIDSGGNPVLIMGFVTLTTDPPAGGPFTLGHSLELREDGGAFPIPAIAGDVQDGSAPLVSGGLVQHSLNVQKVTTPAAGAHSYDMFVSVEVAATGASVLVGELDVIQLTP
jgi:hypothetical protein